MPGLFIKRTKFTKKDYLQVVGVLLLFIVTIPLIISSRNSQEQSNSRLARALGSGNAELIIQPAAMNIAPGSGSTLNVLILPNGERVSSIEMVIDYDPALMQITNITPGTFFTDPAGAGQVGSPQEILKSFSTPGRIHYALGFPMGSQFSSTTAGTAAVVSFTAKGAGVNSPITLVGSGNPQSLVANITGQNVLSSVTNGTITVQVQYSANLRIGNIAPANPQVVGRMFTADILVDTGGEQVSGVDAIISYNPSILYVASISPETGSGFTSFPSLTANSQQAVITVSGNIGSGVTPSPVSGSAIKLATISFVPLTTASSTPLNFSYTVGNRNDSNIVLYDPGSQDPIDILSGALNGSISVQASATATPIPTVTSVPGPSTTPGGSPTPTSVPGVSTTPTATPTLIPTSVPSGSPTPTSLPTPTFTPIPTSTPAPTNPQSQSMVLRYRMQGKTRSGVSNAASISLSIRSINSTALTTYNLAGNTNGETSFSILPGDYVLFLTIPGYLTKQFGTDSQPVTIVSGNTLLDLTGYPLLGGDFNQDGTVNEVDYTLYFLTSYASNNNLVDLDGSGQVNNLDFSILRNNWNKIKDTIY